MPRQDTIERARRDAREGKSPSSQAGEFVKEEIDEIRAGKHGARSAKQAIAIGLSKARRAGVDVPPPKKGRVSEQTRRKAAQDSRKGHEGGSRKPSRSVGTIGRRCGRSRGVRRRLAPRSRSIGAGATGTERA